MSWLDDVLRRGRDNAIPADHPLAEIEAVTFSSGGRPSWAVPGTGLYRVLDETLSQREPLDVQPSKTVTDASAEPLPRRRASAPTWRTRQGDEVTIGDRVALSVLGHPGAVGRILGEAPPELVEGGWVKPGPEWVECRMTACEHCADRAAWSAGSLAGTRLTMHEDNLVILLTRAPGTTTTLAREGVKDDADHGLLRGDTVDA